MIISLKYYSISKGVAYSTPKMDDPLVILEWPGKKKVMNKVPTAVCYRAGNRDIKSWGFECPSPGEMDDEMRVLDRFKLYLDKDFLEDTLTDEPQNRVDSHGDVQMWFEDFLTALYKHIATHICAKWGVNSWESQTVYYIFSVPTTWETAVAETLEAVVRRAGFGKEKDHFVEIKLTEAEAAAVYSASSSKHQRLRS